MDDSIDSQEPQFLYEVTRQFCDYVDEETQAALDKKRNALFDEIQDELLNTENPFQVLLRRFRRAHIEHGQALLGLELLTQNELEGRRKDSLKNIIIEDDVINVVGSLSFGNPQTDNSFSVVAFAGGIKAYRERLCKGLAAFKRLVAKGKVEMEWKYHKNLYFRSVIEHAIEALEVYLPLAKIAGSCVPARIRKAMPVEPHDASSIWHSLLYWLKSPTDESLDIYPKYRRMLSDSVFQDSVDAIEGYLLGDSESVLPESLQQLAGQEDEGPGEQPIDERLRFVCDATQQSQTELGEIITDDLSGKIKSELKNAVNPLQAAEFSCSVFPNSAKAVEVRPSVASAPVSPAKVLQEPASEGQSVEAAVVAEPDGQEQAGEMQSPRALSPPEQLVADRNRWLYAKREEGKTWEAIVELQKEPTEWFQKWLKLSSVSGVRRAVDKHAKANGLPFLRGRGGRPKTIA